jgi:DNA polymerase-3 subunit chi
MTRIDFHSNVPDKLAYACRLARKAYLARNKVVLITDDAATMAQLEAQMWTFSDVDFVPHVAASHALAAVTPVLLSDTDSADLPHYDILINLSRRTPGHFDRFQRMFEIISQDPDDAAAGRQRYSSYKQLAHPLTHFVAGKS